MTLNLETLVTSLLMENDFEIRSYAKKELCKNYSPEVYELINQALTATSEEESMNAQKKLHKMKIVDVQTNDESLDTTDNITQVIETLRNNMKLKKTIRIPISGIMQMYRSGDEFLEAKSKEYIVRNFGRFVYDLIHKQYPTYAKKYGDELYQCGVMGLIKAMKGYNETTSKFTTYCKFFVIHEISDQILFHRNDSSTYYNTVQRQVKDAAEKIRNSGYEPSVARIAIETGLKSDIVKRELDYVEATRFRYLDAEEEKEQPCAYEDTPEHIISKKTGHEQLFRSIEMLGVHNPKMRDVILLKYDGTRTNEEIANQLGITIGQVKKLYTDGLRRLKLDDELASFYGEYISDADNAMKKYSVPKFESTKTTEENVDVLESIMKLNNMFEDEDTSSESVKIM